MNFRIAMLTNNKYNFIHFESDIIDKNLKSFKGNKKTKDFLYDILHVFFINY